MSLSNDWTPPDRDVVSENILDSAPVKITLSLKRGNDYASAIARDTALTYSHVVKVIRELEHSGYVEFAAMPGRKKLVELTEDGESLAEVFERMEEIVR